MIAITIDGRKLEAQENQTVLQVAREHGIDIPTLCAHDALGPHGACRLCVVEAEGRTLRKGLMSSCTLQVSPDLIVATKSPAVVQARKIIFELLLGRASDSTTLRELAARYGVTSSRFMAQTSDDCVRCGLCIRVCKERIGAAALCFAGRGQKKRVTAEFGKLSASCIGCGACTQVCPTGAIRIEDSDGTRRIVVSGRVISEQPLLPCRLCGQPFQSSAQWQRLAERIGEPAQNHVGRHLCPTCARQEGARDRTGQPTIAA